MPQKCHDTTIHYIIDNIKISNFKTWIAFTGIMTLNIRISVTILFNSRQTLDIMLYQTFLQLTVNFKKNQRHITFPYNTEYTQTLHKHIIWHGWEWHWMLEDLATVCVGPLDSDRGPTFNSLWWGDVQASIVLLHGASWIDPSKRDPRKKQHGLPLLVSWELKKSWMNPKWMLWSWNSIQSSVYNEVMIPNVVCD